MDGWTAARWIIVWPATIPKLNSPIWTNHYLSTRNKFFLYSSCNVYSTCLCYNSSQCSIHPPIINFLLSVCPPSWGSMGGCIPVAIWGELCVPWPCKSYSLPDTREAGKRNGAKTGEAMLKATAVRSPEQYMLSLGTLVGKWPARLMTLCLKDP